MQYLTAAIVVIFLTASASAMLHSESVEYKQGDTVCKGFLAYDDALQGKRPGVLVVPEWWGLNDYAKSRASQLAMMGYVAFAADIYGGGATTTDPKEAGKLATQFRSNRPLLRERAKAALDALEKSDMCDSKRVAAIGYCFGGGTVLELARSGADLAGVVSFHGNLDTPNPDDARNIKAKVLVMTGADDPNVPEAKVAAFEDEMRNAKVDWQVVIFGNAVHGFTNPANGSDNSKGVAYNEKADHRSWEYMKVFFAEIFAK
jgi:dienelactone hydrolase